MASQESHASPSADCVVSQNSPGLMLPKVLSPKYVSKVMEYRFSKASKKGLCTLVILTQPQRPVYAGSEPEDDIAGEKTPGMGWRKNLLPSRAGQRNA